MKNKFTIIWFGFLLFLLFCTFSLVSCKAKQPLQKTTIENTDKNTVSDTKETLTINQEILDRIILQIPQIYSSKKECDSLINYYRLELAKSIESSKSSGDNTYNIKYNEQLKQLEILMKIAATQNKEKAKEIHTIEVKTKIETVEVPIKMPLTWWENFFYKAGQILSVIVVTYLVFKLNTKFKIA